MPAYTTMNGFISTDIINGNCVPWGAYSSYATEKTVVFFLVFFTYILPLMLMVFFYSKLVYALRTKVTLLALSLISPMRLSTCFELRPTFDIRQNQHRRPRVSHFAIAMYDSG